MQDNETRIKINTKTKYDDLNRIERSGENRNEIQKLVNMN